MHFWDKNIDSLQESGIFDHRKIICLNDFPYYTWLSS